MHVQGCHALENDIFGVFVDYPKIKHIVQSLGQVSNIWHKTLLPNMINNKNGDFAKLWDDL